MYYYLIIAIIILSLFLTFYYRLKPWQILLFKAITSLCFIILGRIAYELNQEADSYFKMMMIGLVFGFAGDVALGAKEVNPENKSKWLFLGISLFFLGHVFYILAMIEFIDNLTLYLIISGLFIILNLFFIYRFQFEFGSAHYLIYPYIIITSIILTITVANAIIDPSYFKIIIALGACGFVGSDYVLSFLYFKMITKYQRLIKRVNLSLYYCGQFLLALSIFLY